MKYKMPFSQYKQCQGMTKNEFNRWLESFADTMWQQGYDEACKAIPDKAIVIDISDTTAMDDNKEKIKEMLLSVSGVGPKLCDKIIDRIYEVFEGYVGEGSNDGE